EEKFGAQAVMLSYAAWQKYFQSDPEILNRTLTIDGRSFAVAGVMPAEFEFPDRRTEFWASLNLVPDPAGGITSIIPLARLQDEVTYKPPLKKETPIVGNLRRSYPPARAVTSAKLELTKIKDELVRPVHDALVVLTIAVGFVLLIACSNVANLLLARGET